MARRIWANHRTRVSVLLVILLLGWAWRLSYVQASGSESDMKLFVQWARWMARGGLVAVYEQTHSAYPPLATLLLFPMGLMCPRCDIDAAPTTGELLVLRLLSTGFDMLNAIVLFRLGRRTRHAWQGPAAAGLYFLFPTMVLVSGWWSQNDSWFVFFMLIGGICLTRERPVLAWIALALSALIKLQAIILLPVFIAGTWRWFGWKRLVLCAMASMLALGLACVPVWANGQWGNFVSAVTLPIRQDPVVGEAHITLGGHNIWAGLVLLRRMDVWVSYRHAVIPGVTFHAAGTSLLLLSLTLVAMRVFIGSSPRSIFAAMAVSWLIFFQFAVGVGARYLIPATVFLLVACLQDPIWWAPCIGFHGVTLFNLYDTIYYVYDPFGRLYSPDLIAVNIVLTLILSLLAFGLFFAWMRRQVFGSRSFLQANRVERGLAVVGFVALSIFLGLWLAQSAIAQRELEQAGVELARSIRQELGAADVLAINWPKEIGQRFPDARFISPSTGIFQPSLSSMGAVSATVVIYPPWADVTSQIHHWDARYDGYHVTTEMLVERVFKARRVVASNMITAAPRVWRLAEISDKDAGAAPVAHWGQAVQLVSARLEYHDQIVFVHLAWNVAQSLPDDVTVFVHLLDPHGRLVAQMDGDTVQNLIPLGQWQRYPDRVVEETRLVAWPHDAPRGMYTAVIGLYNRSTLERLPIECANRGCENQAYWLKPIQINPE